MCSNPAETDRNGIKRRRVHVCCCSGFTELLHQYSPSLSSFKTPYSCKLYEQMWTDRWFRQPIKTGSTWGQSRLRSIAPAVAALWQTFEAACVPPCHLAECWGCKKKATILWLFFSRSTSELPAAPWLEAFHPSLGSQTSNLLHQSYCKKADIHWKWQLKWDRLVGERFQGGGAASRRQQSVRLTAPWQMIHSINSFQMRSLASDEDKRSLTSDERALGAETAQIFISFLTSSEWTKQHV